jgi:multiple sugar transport system permease protein
MATATSAKTTSVGRGSRKGLRRFGNAATYAVLALWLVFVLFPLYWIVSMSFKNEVDIFTTPPIIWGFTPTLDNYLNVLNISRVGQSTNTGGATMNFPSYFLNSIIITAGAILITMVFGLLAAYAVTRYRFHGRGFISILILFSQMIPVMLIMMPLYITYQQIGLYNTYVGLILAYQLFSLPFFIWLLRSHVSTVPVELEDAARVDGANLFQILRNVVLPLITPGLVASGILVLIGMWNSWVIALLLGGSEIQPVTVGIMNFSAYYQIQWARMAAASTIAIVPMIIAGLFIQRYIVKGLSAGSVKG